jgi:lipoprotein-anchoring transpeptidase ErfK/SrfK
MVRLLVAIVCLCALTLPARPANLDASAINNAEFRGTPPAQNRAQDKIDAVIVKAQILLDRALFSPGEIDGKLAENSQKALQAFADANGLNFQKTLTPELWAKLIATGQEPVVTQYTIADGDVKGPFLKKLPAKMEAMKDLKTLAYSTPREAIAEKFHMSEALLSALNPGKKFDRAGDVIVVANVLGRPGKLTIGRVEVDKSRQTVKAFDPQGALIGFFPATVGSGDKPTPSGTLKVVSSDPNPTYRYNPDYKFKGVKSKRPFTIEPGPNNPVGAYWVGLSAEGYGIHGTPDPSKVSKTQSHGCVRLTNWDATLLGSSLKKGTPVDFIDQAVSKN